MKTKNNETISKMRKNNEREQQKHMNKHSKKTQLRQITNNLNTMQTNCIKTRER